MNRAFVQNFRSCIVYYISLEVIRKSPAYLEALEIFEAHLKAKDAIGTPIQLLDVDLAQRNSNFCVPGYCRVIMFLTALYCTSES